MEVFIVSLHNEPQYVFRYAEQARKRVEETLSITKKWRTQTAGSNKLVYYWLDGKPTGFTIVQMTVV